MKKNKNDIILMVFVCLNFVCFFLLTLFAVPESVPFIFDQDEKIVAMTSKWILILPIIISTTFGILGLLNFKSENLRFFLRSIFVLMLYWNMLIFIYLCFGEKLYVGAISELPLTALFVLPLSVLIFVGGIKVKHAEFGSAWGFRFKENMLNKFLWKQSQIYAGRTMRKFGTWLFVILAFFSFFHFWLISFAIVIVMLAIMIFMIWHDAKHISLKYTELKLKHEQLEKAKIKKQNSVNEFAESKSETKNSQENSEKQPQKTSSETSQNKTKKRKKKGIPDDAKFF